MQSSKKIEFLVGIFVLLGIASVFVLAFIVSDVTQSKVNNSYVLHADFGNIGGLKPRAAVTVAGVRVGRVRSIALDSEDFRALVTLDIDGRYLFPKDTDASILTSGLIGEQYISLTPGGDTQNLKSGDKIKITQPAMILENLIGRLASSLGGDKESASDPSLAP